MFDDRTSPGIPAHARSGGTARSARPPPISLVASLFLAWVRRNPIGWVTKISRVPNGVPIGAGETKLGQKGRPESVDSPADQSGVCPAWSTVLMGTTTEPEYALVVAPRLSVSGELVRTTLTESSSR